MAFLACFLTSNPHFISRALSLHVTVSRLGPLALNFLSNPFFFHLESFPISCPHYSTFCWIQSSSSLVPNLSVTISSALLLTTCDRRSIVVGNLGEYDRDKKKNDNERNNNSNKQTRTQRSTFSSISMEWAVPRDDSEDPIADFTRNAHSIPEFSPLISGLLAPIPSMPNASDWPVPPLMRDTRADFRYDVSLSAGPEFDTDSARDDPELHEDDDISSELHGAVSTSEDTSVVRDKNLNQKVVASMQQPSLSTTLPHSITSGKVENVLQSHQSPNTPASTSRSLPTLTNISAPFATIPSVAQTTPLPQPIISTNVNSAPKAPLAISTPRAETVGKRASKIASANTKGVKRPPIQPLPASVPQPLRQATIKPSNDSGGSQSAQFKSSDFAETSISPVASKASTESQMSPRSSQKPAKSIAKKNGKKTTSSSSPRAPRGLESAPTVSISAGTSAPASGVLSHTKLCRDRLNNMFEKLKHTLPPAPPGVEVKHKAQVLDYAILVLKNMVERTSQLEVELAVSSNKATMDWISKLVKRVDNFPMAAEEVMRLFVKRRGWVHAELWTAVSQTGISKTDPGNDLEETVALSFCRAVCNEMSEGSSWEMFSKEAENRTFRAGEGIPGRVWLSMRPEWVTGLSDSKNFDRANLARKFNVKVCMAVPVTITGKIEGVMCFYDAKHRAYDNHCLELGMRLAWALGNAIGGERAKSKHRTSSGAS